MTGNEKLDPLKATELDLLCRFIDACRQLGLRYYLVGGTMLGAVRHRGFIPWDDDVDVSMPRKDYEVFIRRAQELLPEYCFLQTRATDPAFPYNFAKLRNSSTTFVEKSLKKCRINHGVYIDIFPLDSFPADPREQKRLRRREYWYSRRILRAFALPRKGMKARLMHAALDTVAFFYCPSLRRALDKREALYRSVPESGLLVNYCGAWGDREVVPAAWFGAGRPVEFEGVTAIAPSEYEKMLTQLYGDYMQPPPPEKQVGHHETEVIDLDRPYTDYCLPGASRKS